MWDNSYSIGSDNFPKVINFLEKLINSPQLNVGEDGTHIGFITFSSGDRTRELLSIGRKTSKAELIQWLEGVNYYNLKGPQTFTGTAMKLALNVSTFCIVAIYPLYLYKAAVLDLLLIQIWSFKSRIK